MEKFTTIDDYIASLPKESALILIKMREIIQAIAPDAIEAISYGMPTFKMRGKNLVHFAAWKNHIGFYATPSGNEAFKKELRKYNPSKGAVQFPLDKPIPYDLVKKIVTYRVKEVAKSTTKKKK